MLDFLTQLAIGYSIVSAAILLVAYAFFIDDMRKTPLGILACGVLLSALACIQILTWQFIETGMDLFGSGFYVLLLLTVPPTFFFFSREILMPDAKLSVLDVFHLAPVAFSVMLPNFLIVPVALTIGAGYSIWIARVVWGMRRHVSRFRFELFFFGFFALVAVLVLILGVMAPYIDSSVFYYSYSLFTGAALVLINAAIIGFPQLLADISEAAQSTYAKSTLKDVDIEASLGRLRQAMQDEKLFQNENLNLGMLADAVDLSSHQLSELINSHFGCNFSRYVRGQRIAEAKKQLRNDPEASVLSIGLASGFRSQSNFYTAFRELTGQSPGDYRRNA